MLTGSTTDVIDVSAAMVNASVFTINFAVLSEAKAAAAAAQRQQQPGLSSRGRRNRPLPSRDSHTFHGL